MTPEAHQRSNKIYARIVTFFLILTVVAIFLVLHFTLAKATIQINDYEENRQINVLVEVKPESSTDLPPEAIIGKMMNTELTVVITQDVAQTTTSGTKASGYVTVYNNYSQDQTLVKTTRLLTPDQKLFRISETIVVPAGGQTTVWAEADQEGEEFLIAPSKFTIPGLWEGLQDKIYAQSQEAMKLQSLPQYVVSEQDLSLAKSAAEKAALEQSLAAFNELLPDNLKINTFDVALEPGEIVNAPSLGESLKDFKFSQKYKAYALIFDKNALREAANKKFEKGLASHETLVRFTDSELTYDTMEIYRDQGTAVLSVPITAIIKGNQGSQNIDKDKLVGRSEIETLQYLRDELNIQDAQIKFSPFWVRKIPKLKDHIIIQ